MRVKYTGRATTYGSCSDGLSDEGFVVVEHIFVLQEGLLGRKKHTDTQISPVIGPQNFD